MSDEATQELFDVLTHVLAHVADPHVLLLAASTLARHPEPDARDLLTSFLRHREFLARLDDVTSPGDATRRLARLFGVLRERPDASVRDLCLALSRELGFVTLDDRNLLLLQTLAEVRPMDQPTVDYFARMNRVDYGPINGPLLLHNGSPLALGLFERMIADPEVDAADRVDTLHTGVLPERTNLAIVEMCARLLAAGLPDEVNAGVVESLYDHRSREWFGPAINPPAPPEWSTAPSDVLARLVELAPRARAVSGVSGELAARVDETARELEAILERRRS
jgi:hypothetical protein